MNLKKYICVYICITMIFVLVACQPTPKKEIVIPRDNTEKKVIEAAKQEQEVVVEEKPVFSYETPQHVDERFAVVEGKLDILIDANVNMPKIDSVPVAKVRPNPFTQERADELRKYFMKDGKLVTDYIPTKADYDEMIIEAKRGHLVDGEYVFDESSEKWIKELVKRRKKAPEKDVKNLITDYSINGDEGLGGRIIINGQDKGSLYIDKDSFYYGIEPMYRLSKHKQYTDSGELVELPTVDIKMTEQEAIAVAEKLLEDLNISGMAVREIDKAYFYSEGNYDKKVDYGGYYMEFMRELGGVLPVNIKGFGMSPDDKFEVSPPIRAEIISITIDESGNINNFCWDNPVEMVEVLTEHVDILPFEDIMMRLKEFSKIQFAFLADYGGEAKMVKKIRNIDFSLIYLPIKNNAQEFMYTPCWAFIYKDLCEHTEKQLAYMKKHGMSPTPEDEMGDEYLIFSAVDGASISAYTLKDLERSQRMREEHDTE